MVNTKRKKDEMRLKPIKIDAEKKEKFTKSLQAQEITRGTPLSYDENFPVFRPPYGERALVYVPNHVVETEEGKQLRMDISNVHNINHNGRFERVRCVNGLESLGYGSCPVDAVVSKCFELANLKSEHEMNIRNINPDVDSDERRKVRRKYYDDMIAQNQAEFYTFPVVVLELQGEKGSPVWDAENETLKHKVEWMILSATQYEKWREAFEESDVESETLGGCFVSLNYSVGIKEGMDDRTKRMTAGRNLTVRIKENTQSQFGKALEKYGTSLDKVKADWDAKTEEWDIAKSASTVVQNSLYAPEDLEEYAADLMNAVDMQLFAFQQSGSADHVGVQTSADVSLESVSEPLGILPEGSIDND